MRWKEGCRVTDCDCNYSPQHLGFHITPRGIDPEEHAAGFRLTSLSYKKRRHCIFTTVFYIPNLIGPPHLSPRPSLNRNLSGLNARSFLYICGAIQANGASEGGREGVEAIWIAISRAV